LSYPDAVKKIFPMISFQSPCVLDIDQGSTGAPDIFVWHTIDIIKKRNQVVQETYND